MHIYESWPLLYIHIYRIGQLLYMNIYGSGRFSYMCIYKSQPLMYMLICGRWPLPYMFIHRSGGLPYMRIYETLYESDWLSYMLIYTYIPKWLTSAFVYVHIRKCEGRSKFKIEMIVLGSDPLLAFVLWSGLEDGGQSMLQHLWPLVTNKRRRLGDSAVAGKRKATCRRE